MILVVTNLVTLSTYEGTCLPLVRVIYRVSICSSFGVIGDKIHELVVLLCNTYLTKGVCKKPSILLRSKEGSRKKNLSKLFKNSLSILEIRQHGAFIRCQYFSLFSLATQFVVKSVMNDDKF